MPLALHQKPAPAFSHNRHSTVTTITAPPRARPVSPKIGLKTEAILIFSGFLAKEFFFQRNWIRFSTAMNRRPTISVDRFNEPAPALAAKT